MPSKVFSATTYGIDAKIIEVETDISSGLHSFSIVGLADKAVDESKDRVNSAIKNSGFNPPKKANEKITINLAPAKIKKEGTAFDLPIALAYLSASGQIVFDFSKKIFLGELALSGDLRPIEGILSLVSSAKENGFLDVFVPWENFKEASLIKGINIIPVKTFYECVEILKNEREVVLPEIREEKEEEENENDFCYIKGQEQAKRALVVAASGGYNMLMSGPPGSGKSMLAKAFLTILPDLSEEEQIETTKVHSVAGKLLNKNKLIIKRPFRSPHHSSSLVALTGGGSQAKPGEISLAHNGVLFLDEFPEFQKSAIEALRQPLEDGFITVSRAFGSFSYPANIMLIATQNPCPCGYYESEQKECTCSMNEILRYQKKISGPIMDRIDIQIEVPMIEHSKLAKSELSEKSEFFKRQVQKAREIQKERFKNEKINLNSQMGQKEIKKYCSLEKDEEAFLKNISEKEKFSARSYFKIIKLARTIADMDNSENIKSQHLAEAVWCKIKE